MTEAQLIIIEGPGVGQRLPLTNYPVALGRNKESQLIVKDPSISRRHAEFYEVEDGLGVRDLGSKNGIVINGRSCREGRIYHSDTLLVGKVSFKLIAPSLTKVAPEASPATSPATPAPVDPTPASVDAPASAPNTDSSAIGTRATSTGELPAKVSASTIGFMFVLLFGMVLAALTIFLAIDSSKPEPKIILMSAGEKRLIEIYPLKPTIINVVEEGIVRLRNDPEKAWMLNLEARRPGETLVNLMAGTGKEGEEPIGQLKIIVRGSLPPLIDEAEYKDLINEDRERLARSMIEGGDSLTRDQLTESIRQYRRARIVAKSFGADSEIAVLASQKLKDAQRKLDAQLKALWGAFKLAYDKSQADEMRGILQKIVKLVPDESYSANQRAKIYWEFVKDA